MWQLSVRWYGYRFCLPPLHLTYLKKLHIPTPPPPIPPAPLLTTTRQISISKHEMIHAYCYLLYRHNWLIQEESAKAEYFEGIFDSLSITVVFQQRFHDSCSVRDIMTFFLSLYVCFLHRLRIIQRKKYGIFSLKKMDKWFFLKP